MKKILTIITVALISILFATGAFAAPQTEDIIYLDYSKSIVFWVEWDIEDPNVVFISPDGTELDPDVASETTATVRNDSDLYFTVYNAAAGQWKVRFNKGSNTAVDISVYDYISAIYIESFTIGNVDGNSIPVNFKVGGEDGQYYNYRISAVIDHSGGEKLLKSGSSYTGNENNVTIYLDSLSTYDKYMMKLYVWYDNDGTDIFDFLFSDEFSYTNTELDSTEANFELTVIPEEYLVIIDWEDRLPYDAEKVLIALFENNGDEPAVFDEYMISENSVQLSYDPAATRIDVEFTVTYNGTNAAPLKKGTDLKDIKITMPQGTSFNSLVFPIGYTGFTNQQADLTINGYVTELILNGDGKLNATLDDDWNTVEFTYKDSDDINWLIRRDIFIDRYAPILNMSRAYDGISVDADSIIISGTALDCETLTINGETVSFTTEGLFSKEVNLSSGENIITVLATDTPGNESLYTATIYRGIDSSAANEQQASLPGSLIEKLTQTGNYYILIGVSGLCAFGMIYALIFWKKRKGDNK